MTVYVCTYIRTYVHAYVYTDRKKYVTAHQHTVLCQVKLVSVK